MALVPLSEEIRAVIGEVDPFALEVARDAFLEDGSAGVGAVGERLAKVLQAAGIEDHALAPAVLDSEGVPVFLQGVDGAQMRLYEALEWFFVLEKRERDKKARYG